ncbi:hypothetical protein PtB15_10B193 [Puccinia triticina]|nr:hypothetical protein PtB15_10B193 [Puccinia triticina]
MVANYRQYVFLHKVLLTYLLKELDISVVGASAGPTGRVPGAPEIGGLSSNDEHVPKPGHPSASRARGSPLHDPTKEAGTDSIGPPKAKNFLTEQLKLFRVASFQPPSNTRSAKDGGLSTVPSVKKSLKFANNVGGSIGETSIV